MLAAVGAMGANGPFYQLAAVLYEAVNWRGRVWWLHSATTRALVQIRHPATTAVATPAVQVLLEFVVEHIREPSGGKSRAC
jgi:hypothetical protein